MSDLLLTIDGREVHAREGMSLLEAARSAGIDIPTLCHHEKLEPFGACRLCIVEVDGRPVASCLTPVVEGLRVTTRTPALERFRKTLLELQLSHAPHSPRLLDMAHAVGADPNRFAQESSFCIHCGLCVRYCAEVKGAHAVGFIDRGIRKEISFIPRIAAAECEECKECFPLCPTSYLQAAYLLARSLFFTPRQASRGV
jgi:NADH dehydrogenase/NADH:ubiquinone oxidoreductase subunit G